MTNPRLLDADGNAYSAELDWSGVKEEPIPIDARDEFTRREHAMLEKIAAQGVAIIQLRGELELQRMELDALRKATRRAGKDGD